jgi:hypothetical protein
MNTELTTEQLKNICKIGQKEATCAFILMLAPDGIVCAKGNGIEKTIRSRLSTGSMSAKGDNCSGPPKYELNMTS